METQELIASLALAQEAAVTYTDIDQAQDMLQINWDTRAVTIPKSVTNAGVKNDHLSKKLVFSMDRYMCGVDLANHTFAIHFINVDKWDSKKKNYDDCASGVYPVTNIDLSVDGKVTCEWEITNAATQVVGDVVFALHVFTIVDSAFTYHLGTTPTLLDLLDTVNATEHGKNITPDEIEVYIQKMADLSAEIDAKVAAAEAAATRAEEAAANFEVDDTLSVAGKAADAAATGAKLSQLSGENAELKGDLVQISKNQSIDISSSGVVFVKYSLQQGEVVKVHATVGVNLWSSTESYMGTDIEELGFVGANSTKSFTATGDGKYIRIYSTGSGTVTFEKPNTEISKIKDDIVLIKNDIDLIKEAYVGSDTHRNKVIELPLKDDYYISNSNGLEAYNTEFCCTGFIDVEKCKKIGVSLGLAQFAFYNKDGSYNSGIIIANSDHLYQEYEVPDSAKYVRLSIAKSKKENAFFALNNGVNCPIGDVIVNNQIWSVDTDFHSLRSAVDYAIQFKNTRVIIVKGTYTLTNEFSSEIEQAGTTQYGICLENGVHLLFMSGTKVKALYEGSNVNVTHYFAPFYSGSKGGGFTLENLDIEASNTRYCVHDELGGLDVPINNKYLNCRMVFDNTNAPINWYPTCIGGGTGLHSYVDIIGCYFKTKKAETEAIDTVSYHNANKPNAYSVINIKNSYFEGKGRFRVSHYGESQLISKAYASGNSFGSEPVVRYEVAGSTTPQNFELIAWNNEIRS